jgi:ribonuclease HI
MEAIADLMEYVTDNEIPGNFAVHSKSQAAIARVGQTGPGPRQDRAIRDVKAVKYQLTCGWHTCIEWVLGYTGMIGNERVDMLAGQPASERKKG